jgi:hypothetical protein
VVAALALTMTIPERYVSTAVIKTADADPDGINAAAQSVLSRASLTRLILDEGLYPSERARSPLEEIIEKMRNQDVAIRKVGVDDFAFSVSFTGPDAAGAQRTTQRLAASFVDAKVGSLLDPASLPSHPNGPRRSRNIIMGLVTGILAGAIFALFNGLKVWKLAAALGVAGLAVGVAAAYLLPERYSSMAVIRYGGLDGALIDQVVHTVTTPSNLETIVQRFGLYPNDPDARTKLRENLRFQPIQRLRPGVGAMAIQFDYGDKYIAQKVTADVESQLIVLLMDEGIRRGSDVKKNIKLVDPPSLGRQPTSPNRPVIEGMGSFVGIAAAVGLGLWRYFRGPLPVVAPV